MVEAVRKTHRAELDSCRKLQNSANVLGQLAIILLILVGCPPICILPTSNACDFAPCAFAGCSQRIRCLLSGT